MIPRPLVLLLALLPCVLAFGQHEPSPGNGNQEVSSGTSTGNISAPDLTPGADGKLSQEQMRELFRVVADKDIENEKRQRDYT